MADVSVTETRSLETDGIPRLDSLQMWATERVTGLTEIPVYNWLSHRDDCLRSSLLHCKSSLSFNAILCSEGLLVSPRLCLVHR